EDRTEGRRAVRVEPGELHLPDVRLCDLVEVLEVRTVRFRQAERLALRGDQHAITRDGGERCCHAREQPAAASRTRRTRQRTNVLIRRSHDFRSLITEL